MTVKPVAVVDYGIGNIDSVLRAVEEAGGQPALASERRQFSSAAAIILPGVGAFKDGMDHLRKRGLVELLSEVVCREGVPCLGICLGMQLLASSGEEGGSTAGLGWIEGRCERLEPAAPAERIPHIGWNEVDHRDCHPLFRGIESGRDFYFVHSYALQPTDPAAVVATTPYAGTFASVVARDNVFGVQFHPEKSQKSGLQLLRNFLELAC